MGKKFFFGVHACHLDSGAAGSLDAQKPMLTVGEQVVPLLEDDDFLNLEAQWV